MHSDALEVDVDVMVAGRLAQLALIGESTARDLSSLDVEARRLQRERAHAADKVAALRARSHDIDERIRCE